MHRQQNINIYIYSLLYRVFQNLLYPSLTYPLITCNCFNAFVCDRIHCNQDDIDTVNNMRSVVRHADNATFVVEKFKALTLLEQSW